MYRFQIRAFTQPGETIALVGSHPEMGLWDAEQCIQLRTSKEAYPLWWVDLELNNAALAKTSDRFTEYKYVRLTAEGSVEWEAWGSNRWVPLEVDPLPSLVVIEDGWIGSIPSYPYGYFAEPVEQSPTPKSPQGLKIVVIGSSVALGCNAWLLKGWAWQLEQALQYHYGHQLVNVSEIGANVSTTIARFFDKVIPEQPDIVIIALSLGNEGLAFSAPHQRWAIQQRFENGLQQLIKMTRELGAMPVLGGLYPNSNYAPEHYKLLCETHQRISTWGVPVLDWLKVLDDGQGRWKAGISSDAAHPNTRGHQLMYEAIALNLFDLTKADLANKQHHPPLEEVSVYQDNWGFHVLFGKAENSLRFINTTPHIYTINSDWQQLNDALQTVKLPAGLYITENQTENEQFITLQSLFVKEDSTIHTNLSVPSNTSLIFYPLFHFFAPQHSQVLFNDGALSILKVAEQRLYIINESDHEYNIQPMWQEVRSALKSMPLGVYDDPSQPDASFRTLIIGNDGLESRVKSPPYSAIALSYKCSLANLSRIAIVPLGDRCAVRMLLYKLEYDGPAFPFDLTRTTNLSDVADIIQNDFQDMWNPNFLHYSPDAGRIYHTKWTGLSFAHEVEDSEHPEYDMSPVYERMRVRYSARSKRFGYVLQNSDEILFVRTGLCDRGHVVDLVNKLTVKCQGKPFRLLIISPQDSQEFTNLPHVLHYNLEFNPDRMYADLSYWLDCTEIMREILTSLNISSKNLFWCPPNLPKQST